MTPSVFVIIDALPLSANVKVDRKALLTQKTQLQSLEAVYVAPQNQLEKAIAVIFQEVLDIPKVSIHDNFFDLGGNSLLLAKVYRSLIHTFPDQTPSFSLVDLFHYPSVKMLAQHLSQKNPNPFLEKQMTAREHQLTQGKDRLKYRLKKSKQVDLIGSDLSG